MMSCFFRRASPASRVVAATEKAACRLTSGASKAKFATVRSLRSAPKMSSAAATRAAAAAVAGAAGGGAGGAGGGADAVVRQRAVIDGLAALNQRLLDESAKQQLQVWKHRLTSALFDAKVLLALPGAVGGGGGGGGAAGDGDGGDGQSEEDVFGLFASLGQAAAEYDAFATRAAERLQKGQDQDQAAPAAAAGDGGGDGGDGDAGDDDTEVSAFFANVKALVGQVTAAKATAEALVLATPTKPVTAPVLLAVGLHENANLMALIGMAKPAHVALVTLRTAAQAYDYIHLTRVPGADFRPHAFRIITTAELHAPLRAGARALTLTPTLDCAYFDPDGATPDGTGGKLDGFEALTARLQFQ